LRQHILATPLGKKKSSSAAMAGDVADASKIDPEDIIDAEYDNIPEKCRMQFEAQLKREHEEATRRLLACMLREDSARRDPEARIHHAVKPIYFHDKQCKHCQPILLISL